MAPQSKHFACRHKLNPANWVRKENLRKSFTPLRLWEKKKKKKVG